MQMHTYHLRALSPFHLGERGIGLEASDVVAHADTVFSALCSVGREVYGLDWVKELLAVFQESPPFRLSSAFPFVWAASHPLRLYPRPLGNPPGMDAGNFAVAKRLKAVEFVSEAIFVAWINGTSLAPELPQEGEIGPPLLQDGHVWITRDEMAALQAQGIKDREGRLALWERWDVPRVTVDRAHSSSAVYQVGRVTFQPGGGLWLGFVWNYQTELASQIEGLLPILGHAGLGGERSSGHGQFEVTERAIVELPDPAESCVLLSLYWPVRPGEAPALADSRAAYKLLVRRGWIGSPEGRALRRKAVRMVAEGSVLPGVPDPTGGLADVTPDVLHAHRVYRYGYALAVGMEAI